MLIFLLISPGKYIALAPQCIRGEEYRNYREQAEIIEQKTEAGSSILYTTKADGVSTYRMNYYLNDRRLDDRFQFAGLDYVSAEKTEIWDQLVRAIGENDYFYVFEDYDVLDAVLGVYTAEGTLSDQSLYRVITDNGNLELIKL